MSSTINVPFPSFEKTVLKVNTVSFFCVAKYLMYFKRLKQLGHSAKEASIIASIIIHAEKRGNDQVSVFKKALFFRISSQHDSRRVLPNCWAMV